MYHSHNHIDIASYITALAAAWGLVVAIIGLNAWKKQLKGKTDYELARRYLKALYKMRNAFSHVRNPWVPIGESMAALKEKGYTEADHSDNRKVNAAIYSRRWEKMMEASSDLDIESLEAEVSWGNEATGLLDEIYGLRGKLLSHINRLIEGQEEIRPDREILYEVEGDKFSLEVKGAIKKIVDYLRPHLK